MARKKDEAEQPDEPTKAEEVKVARRKRRSMRIWLGRPSKALLRLQEQFIAALLVDFEEDGPAAIQRLRSEDPLNYLRIITLMMPRKLMQGTIGVRVDEEELAGVLAEVRRVAAAHPQLFGGSIEGTWSSEPPAALPALPQADPLP
jgi:hypothetical protein